MQLFIGSLVRAAGFKVRVQHVNWLNYISAQLRIAMVLSNFKLQDEPFLFALELV